MIILRDVPFYRMARFLYDNVCEAPRELALGPDSDDDRREIGAGLADYVALLKEIYADTASYGTGAVETEEIKTSYASLLNTVRFLLGCFTVGAVRRAGERYEIIVDKADLKSAYKGGNVSGRIETLRRFGLATSYVRDGDTCTSTLASGFGIMDSQPPTHFPVEPLQLSRRDEVGERTKNDPTTRRFYYPPSFPFFSSSSAT